MLVHTHLCMYIHMRVHISTHPYNHQMQHSHLICQHICWWFPSESLDPEHQWWRFSFHALVHIHQPDRGRKHNVFIYLYMYVHVSHTSAYLHHHTLHSVKWRYFNKKCILHHKSSSTWNNHHYVHPCPLSSKPNFTSLAIFLAKLAYLAMLSILQLMHTAGSVHQLKIK